MPLEAFVCPHCRTWVEGRGSTIRCPACGQRFSAEEARLGRPRRDTAFENLDYEVPVRPGWDVPDDAREPIDASRESQGAHGWELPEPATRREPDTYDQPNMDRRTQEPASDSESWHWGDESAHTEGETRAEDNDGESPWGWIIGIGVLMLFLVGGRFLSGELFVVAFLALIALQWFLGRNKSDG